MAFLSLSRSLCAHTHLCVILRLTCPTAVQAAEIGKVLLEKNNQLEEDNELLANDMVALRQQLVETQHELSIAQAAKAQLAERNQGLQQDNLRLSRAAQMVCVVWCAPSEPSPLSLLYATLACVCVATTRRSVDKEQQRRLSPHVTPPGINAVGRVARRRHRSVMPTDYRCSSTKPRVRQCTPACLPVCQGP